MQTDKKVAAVTGSRRGIGFAVAQRLLEQGYLLLYPPQLVRLMRAKLWTHCEKFQKTVCIYNVTYLMNGRENLIESVSSKCGRLDVLVNNAGVAPASRMDLLETTQESYDRVLDTNLKGTFFMCQLAANAMIKMRAQKLHRLPAEDHQHRLHIVICFVCKPGRILYFQSRYFHGDQALCGQACRIRHTRL